MKQGPLPSRSELPSLRRRWRLISWAIAALLFAGWYVEYGPAWILKRESSASRKLMEPASYDQRLVVPKIAGGASSMHPLKKIGPQEIFSSQLVWTPINGGGDSGQLLVDASNVHLWRKAERSAWFKLIPKPNTMDENWNKPILYELFNDSFKCADGTAVKLRLNVYFDDGTFQDYFPWGYAAEIWIPVKPDTPLSHEMKFVCAIQLSPESPAK